MSPRRKSGLSPEDLQALKHLPAVIRALENLQEQHAKVRALMGVPVQVPHMQVVADPTMPPGTARLGPDAQGRSVTLTNIGPIAAITGPRPWGDVLEPKEQAAPTANLVTDERREYEAAKKAGKEVPPDLANISEAQRERMAEQKALVQQMRRAKGLPVAGEVEPVTEDQVVRTEELPTSESGSVGGEEDPEAR